jgi:mRNA interferase MazF
LTAPRWSEVWEVDFGNPIGHEQAYKRPALVVSSDWFNDTKAGMHVVVPFSTTLRKLGTHYRIDPPEGGLDAPSMAMVEQIRTVSIERFSTKRGAIKAESMAEVSKRLKVLLLMGSRTAA